MQNLIYVLFLLVFTIDFFIRKGLAPRAINLAPDMLAVFTLILVVGCFATRKTFLVRPGYVFIGGMLLLVFIAGAVLNGVETTTMFVSLRTYLKYLPFFLLPLVYVFSDAQISRQLRLLGWLAVVQLPVALYQRLWESRYVETGDWTRGTLDTSGKLSIFLICAVTYITALYFRRQLSLRAYLLLLVVFSVPTFINETKATLVLLPLALMVPAVLSAQGGKRVRLILSSGLVAACLLSVFVPIYDHFMEKRWGYGLLDFLTMEGRVERYLAPTVSGTAARVGRVDAIVMPFKKLSDDPTQLLLGLGVGNVSDSFLGDKFSGAYWQRYGPYVYGSMSQLLWEIGVLGTLLFCGLWFHFLLDTMELRKSEGFKGIFALGWAGILAVAFPGFFYVDVIGNNALSTVFWFYCGHVVASVTRMRQERSAATPYTI